MNDFPVIEKSITSRYHGIKISGSQKSFLTESAIFIVEQQKESMGYRFVPECNHTQESHTCQLFRFFFLPYLKDHWLLRSWNFAAMATWRNDFRDLCYVYKILSPEGNHCKSVKRSRNDRNASRRVVSPPKAASLIRQTIYAVSSWFCGKRCYNVGALKLQVMRMCACSADATFVALWKFGQNGKSDWPFLL